MIFKCGVLVWFEVCAVREYMLCSCCSGRKRFVRVAKVRPTTPHTVANRVLYQQGGRTRTFGGSDGILRAKKLSENHSPLASETSKDAESQGRGSAATARTC